MWQSLQRLSVGLGLIALTSSVLLFSDLARRKPAPTPTASNATSTNPTPAVRVALFQMASQTIIDDGAAGVLESLKQAGFVDGQRMVLKRFNAEGDVSTANTIAQELTGGSYDLVITLTTGALQAVANANRQRKVPHVFGLVTDPTIAGVQVGTEPMDHPAHLVGIGTMPPADQALELARTLNPKLSRVGIAWNPAEVNSEVSTKLARAACKKLNIELLETSVENTSAVKEAISSLINRQVEALLVGGDVTVLGAMDVVARSGSDAGIPTFTCLPGNAAKGALFDIGANYYEVGRKVGSVAARVLNGEAIAKIPVEIAIPPKLFVNTVVAKKFGAKWAIPAEILAKADSYIDETGQHDKALPASAKSSAPAAVPPQEKPLGRLWNVHILSYVNSQDVAEAERGLQEGLKKAGLVPGRDYAVKTANAQGDMATLNGLVDSAVSDHADLLLTVSTQALQSSIRLARGTPIVFTMVANPFAAGAGKTDSDHLPNVTGAYGANDVKRMMPIIRQVLPTASKLGTLYVPSEVNSVYSYNLLEEAAKTAKYELASMGVSAGTEVLDATQSLCEQHLDAICLSNSNLTGVTFPTIAQVTGRRKMPVFAFLGSTAPQGAVVVLTRDFYDMGVDSANLAARVMRGESAASVPFHACTASKLYVNRASANACGITLPDDLINAADRVFDK